MRSLPNVNYVPTSSAGRALFRAALVLVPMNLGLYLYSDANTVLEFSAPFERDGQWWIQPFYRYPLWADGVRLASPWLALALLLGTGCINRRDAGLTLGPWRVALFWVAAPVAVVVVVVVATLGALLSVALCTDGPWQSAFTWPTALLQQYDSAGDFWLIVWEVLVFAPLMEDTLYRGIMAPGLEWLGGRRLALLGSGVAWAGLHLLYHRPVSWIGFYFFCGVFGAWVFLKARSLTPVIALHVLTNLAGIVIFDVAQWHAP